MTRSRMIVGLILSVSAVSGIAQSCPPHTTIPELVKALDEAVSGPANKDRVCMRALLMPDAKLIPVSKGPDGTWAPHVLTIDDWIARVAKRGDTVFYELQVKYSVESYGQIAQLWSTYETRDTPDGKATVRGINAIQAVKDGADWKISQILWRIETPPEPIAVKDLP